MTELEHLTDCRLAGHPVGDLRKLANEAWSNGRAFFALSRVAMSVDEFAAIEVPRLMKNPWEAVLWAVDEACPLSAYRALLDSAWHRTGGYLAEKALGRPGLVDCFKRANFDTSPLPDNLDLYRGGTCGPNFSSAQLAMGWSWTLDPKVAAFFAISQLGDEASQFPCIVRMKAPSAAAMVLREATGHWEAEVIVDSRPFIDSHRIEGCEQSPHQLPPGWRTEPSKLTEWRKASMMRTPP